LTDRLHELWPSLSKDVPEDLMFASHSGNTAARSLRPYPAGLVTAGDGTREGAGAGAPALVSIALPRGGPHVRRVWI